MHGQSVQVGSHVEKKGKKETEGHYTGTLVPFASPAQGRSLSWRPCKSQQQASSISSMEVNGCARGEGDTVGGRGWWWSLCTHPQLLG